MTPEQRAAVTELLHLTVSSTPRLEPMTTHDVASLLILAALKSNMLEDVIERVCDLMPEAFALANAATNPKVRT